MHSLYDARLVFDRCVRALRVCVSSYNPRPACDFQHAGYDCSRLFADVVMACSSHDLIVKKMCYLYLSNYSRSNEDLTTLCINTLSKDCNPGCSYTRASHTPPPQKERER